MKACLMKVNYDPKYVTPGMKRTHCSLQDRKTTLLFPNLNPHKTRLNMTKQIYAAKVLKPEPSSQREGGSKPHRVHHSAPDFVFRTMKSVDSEKVEVPKKQTTKEKENSPSEHNEDSDSDPKHADQSTYKVNKSKKADQQKVAILKTHTPVKLKPLRDSNKNSSPDYMSHSYGDPVKPGPYVDKSPRRHLTQTSFPLFNTRHKTNQTSSNLFDYSNRHNKDQGNMPMIHRSKTAAPLEHIKFRSVAMIEMERRARIEAEKATREKKVFSILGPYPCLRTALRRRGWVEKFPNCPNPSEMEIRRKQRISEENNDNSNKNNKEKLQPWDEENGYYGLMSYLVRNSTPTFMFTIKSSDVDIRVTKSNQLVNHYGKARHFTTKSGLCLNLRSVIWYENTDPSTFYPRCYTANESDEKKAFIDDYHWTACLSFIRSFAERYKNPSNIPHIGDNPEQPAGLRHPRLPLVSSKSLDLAIQQVEKFLKCRGHNDIDDLFETDILADCEWEQFLNWYNLFVHEGSDLSVITTELVENCRTLLDSVQEQYPQYEVDGVRNMWIIKPGAMSRGRGIQCTDSLEVILKAIDSNDCNTSLVVQKYIERPLLVYETKFDIRQWFLVTDWNPLTVWIYKDNYLRFCSREFTLQDFSPAVHLSNNSVSKNIQNGPRSAKLPEDNTWTSDEFVEYLGEINQASMWKKKVLPGIKNAIICSLLCTQEYIEGRKSAFELYGADFMLTGDFQPWLLEINSSPSMSRSTHATAELVERVLEDTIKVVLDRRSGKTTDTGRFELSYKQNMIQDPPPLDQNLIVHGRKVRNRSHERSILPKRDKSPRKSPAGKR